MTEQSIFAGNIEAGGNVTIAPRQYIGVTGSGVRGWPEALLRGPVEKAGQVQRARLADEHVDNGEDEVAASVYLAVAQALDDQGFGPAATSYKDRAAEAYTRAGKKRRAFDLLMKLSRAALDDGDLTAVFRVRRAREVAPPELTWEADALKARANWPEQEEGDVEALRRAWEETRGTPDEMEWAAALVELLLLNGEQGAALAVAREARKGASLVGGARLWLELDFLDLLEMQESGPDAEAHWRDLLDWAEDPQLPPDVTATVQQRRAVVLGRRGDQEGARKFFRLATQVWAREPGYDDQAAQAYFSGGSAAAALGDISVAFDDARPLALSLRGASSTPTSRVERLVSRGLQALVGGKHPDALRYFAIAYNLSRRAGNLSDFFQAAEGLGDVLAAGGRPAMALASYVQAGNSKKAAEVGGTLSVDDILAGVPIDGARWELLAAWAAIAGAGRLVSDEGAATVATFALRQLQQEAPEAFPINTSFYAARALGNVICAIPDEMLDRSLEKLRQRLREIGDEPKQLVEPLLLASLAGRSDETAILIEAMLNENIQASLPVGLLRPLLEDRPDQQEKLIAAANDGNEVALQYSAFWDLLGKDKQLVQRAQERVRAAINAHPREVSEENGRRTVSYGIGTLAPVGAFARFCEPVERVALAQGLLRILEDPDPEMPIMNRVSAVEALHNLASAMPDEMVDRVADALLSRASSSDEPAELDRIGVDDPLARFRINMAPKDALQTAALEALSMLAQGHPVVLGRLAKAVWVAMQSGSDRLFTSGLRVLANNSEIELPDLHIPQFFAHPSELVRVAAIDAISEREPETSLHTAIRLAQDPSPRVRTRLVGIAAEIEGAEPLLSAFAEDRDSYVRAMARRRLAD